MGGEPAGVGVGCGVYYEHSSSSERVTTTGVWVGMVRVERMMRVGNDIRNDIRNGPSGRVDFVQKPKVHKEISSSPSGRPIECRQEVYAKLFS